MGTDRATRARIAAMTAAEAAVELNARDPFAVLARTSAVAARRVDADPAAVYREADEIVVRVFRGRLGKPESLEFLCVSCGEPVARNRLVCARCEPEFVSDDERRPE